MNNVTLIGHLGADAEENSGFLNFPLATTERWTDRQTGDKREHTDWHRVSTKHTQLKKYLVKGKQVAIHGTIRMETKEGKDGEKRKYTNIVAFRIELLGNAPAQDARPEQTTEVPF